MSVDKLTFDELLNNNEVYITTESSYIKLNLDKHTMQQSQHTSVRLFSDKAQLLSYVKYIPPHILKLIDIFTPGQLHLKLNNYSQDPNEPFVIAYIPGEETIQNLAAQFRANLFAQYPSPVLALNQSEIVCFDKNRSPLIINQGGNLENILPTFLDATDEENLVIERPGSISFEDLRLILPGKINLKSNYLKPERIKDFDLFLINNPKQINSSKAVILGSKEKLAEFFGLRNHFKLCQNDNFTLINLGSQTNPENVVRHFSMNLVKAKNQGIVNLYLLDQKWPASRWGEILNFLYKSISLRLPSTISPETVTETTASQHAQNLAAATA